MYRDISFHRFEDGEISEYWDPVVSTVRGSLAEERQKSSGRFGKDRKESKLVTSLNSKFRISLYEVIGNHKPLNKQQCDEEATGVTVLKNRLSYLGARYPSVPGLGIYVRGLSSLEGKGHWKKIFSILYWISCQDELDSYWKYVLLSPLGKILLTDNTEGTYKQNCHRIFLYSGQNQLAKEFADDILQNKSAKADCLKRGESLARSLSIQFYENTRPYNPKVRRRGYSRSSPVRPGSSKSALREANSSDLALFQEGYLTLSPEGGFEMEKKEDIETLLFETFRNSLEAFKLYQEKELQRLHRQELKSERKVGQEENPPPTSHPSLKTKGRESLNATTSTLHRNIYQLGGKNYD